MSSFQAKAQSASLASQVVGIEWEKESRVKEECKNEYHSAPPYLFMAGLPLCRFPKEVKDFLYPSLSILLVSKQERFVSVNCDKNNCTCRVTRRSTSLTELSYSFCSKIIYLILIIYFFFLLCLTTNIYEPIKAFYSLKKWFLSYVKKSWSLKIYIWFEELIQYIRSEWSLFSSGKDTLFSGDGEVLIAEYHYMVVSLLYPASRLVWTKLNRILLHSLIIALLRLIWLTNVEHIAKCYN